MTETPVIETVDLTKAFSETRGMFGKRSSLLAVDGVSLKVFPGETLGLAGESGCGKSTLAKMIMGIISPTSGSVRFHGNQLETMSSTERREFAEKVQMIFQDPFSSLNPRMRVGEIVAEPFEIHRTAAGEAKRKKVLDLLRRVGLSEEHYQRFPHEFSGGQRQRIGIARALALSPELVVADEPVSALDISIQAQIINLLLELKRELSISFLLIAHDLSVVRHLCDRVAIMYLGKIVESGSRDDIFDRYLHPYTEALLSAVPGFQGRKRVILGGDLPSPFEPPPGCPFHTRCPYAQFPACSASTPHLDEKEPGHFAACHFSTDIFRQRS